MVENEYYKMELGKNSMCHVYSPDSNPKLIVQLEDSRVILIAEYPNIADSHSYKDAQTVFQKKI